MPRAPLLVVALALGLAPLLIAWAAPERPARVDIRAVGDAAHIAGNARFGKPPKDWVKTQLRRLEPLRSPDVNLLNFEATVARSCTAFVDKPFTFASPPEAVQQFAAWGFNLIGLSNNHSTDCKTPTPEREIGPALRATKRLAKSAAFHGVAESTKGLEEVARLEVRGLKIGMVSLKAWKNGDKALVANLDNRHRVFAALQRAPVDVRILSLHGGVESVRHPAAEVVDVAREFIARYGGDVVFAHHPHVAQGVELLQRRDGRAAVIFFSLGNFLHNGLSTRGDGMLARVVATKAGIDPEALTVHPLAAASTAPRPVHAAALKAFLRTIRTSSAAAHARALPADLRRVELNLRETQYPAAGISLVPRKPLKIPPVAPST